MTLPDRADTFVRLPHAWAVDPLIGAAALAVLAVLLAHRHGRAGRCDPSVPRIASMTGLSERTVQRTLQEVEALGLVTRVLRPGQSTAYVVHDDRTPVTVSPPTPVTVSPPPRQAGTTTPVTVTPELDEGNQTKELETVAAADASAPPEPPAPSFDDWWALYPRKVGKKAARLSWATAVKAASPERLMAALIEQRPSMLARQPQFVPHPRTWLTQGRWDDDVPMLEVTAAEPTRNGSRTGSWEFDRLVAGAAESAYRPGYDPPPPPRGALP